MPSPVEILATLGRVANEAFWVAVLVHVVAVAVVVAIARGWRPSQRVAGLACTAPLALVSALAFAWGNPFNGAVFALVALASVGIAVRMETTPIAPASTWAFVAGAALVAFGLVYPHFLEGRSVLACLVGAPTGLVPCPTLSLLIGVALLTDGLGSRAWSLLLVVAGLFYGLVGVFRLGVVLDVGLLLGAAALLAQVVLPHPRQQAAVATP